MPHQFDPADIIKAARGTVIDGLTHNVARQLTGHAPMGVPDLWTPFSEARRCGDVVLDDPEWTTTGTIWRAWSCGFRRPVGIIRSESILVILRGRTSGAGNETEGG